MDDITEREIENAMIEAFDFSHNISVVKDMSSL